MRKLSIIVEYRRSLNVGLKRGCVGTRAGAVLVDESYFGGVRKEQYTTKSIKPRQS